MINHWKDWKTEAPISNHSKMRLQGKNFWWEENSSGPFLGEVHFSSQTMTIDDFAYGIFSRQSYGNTGDRVPVAVSGDGNCLFNALSMALVGTEELAIASELRVRTCIELVDNPQIYEDGLNHEDIKLVSPSYRETCINCALPSGYIATPSLCRQLRPSSTAPSCQYIRL